MGRSHSGDNTEPLGGPTVVSIGSECLAQRNVVCRTCGESCEQGAIRFSPRLGGVALPLLDNARCNDCGDCLVDCPTLAIRRVPVVSDFPSHALQGAA
jgi:ferredoxin-type protein NapF